MGRCPEVFSFRIYIDFLKQERFNALNDVTYLVEAMECRADKPLAAAKKLNEYVFTNFNYIKGITSVETTLDEVWKLKAGVCQDFAHVLLEMIKIINMPARYVSGYICPNKTGMRGEGDLVDLVLARQKDTEAGRPDAAPDVPHEV